MKTLVLAALVFLTLTTAVFAACYTHTYYVNGRWTTCQTCCTGNYCTTTCF